MPERLFLDTLAKLDRQFVLTKYKECTPKILVVTDGLSFNPADGFGLTQFVSTLATSTIHGMTPQVVTKVRTTGGFRFDDPTEGVLKSRYDVVFILGIYGAGTNPVSAAEKQAIGAFMQAGGGVFATGDHQDLGASMSADLPRVRNMRHWTSGTPHVSNTNRISTNVSGANEREDFDDQSDIIPQNLYPNFRTVAGNPAGVARPGMAHPLLQLAPLPGVTNPVIEVFPDHPHEGECFVPTNLSTTFLLGSANVDEWPAAPVGGRVSPEAVAYSMSHGSGFSSGPTGPKDALVPRAFVAICAYDGQRANVGRVVTDATWHHFVNINLDGTGSGLLGLQSAPGVDGPALTRIRQYYRNIATWLMPKNTRRCLRFPHFLQELRHYPLFEEVVVPHVPIGPDPGPDPLPLVQLGKAVVDSLLLREPAFVAETVLEDALQDAVGERAAAQLSGTPARFGNLTPRELAFGALGAITNSVLATLETIKDPQEVSPHKTFDGPALEHARKSTRRLIDWQRAELRALDQLLENLPND